MVSFDSSFFLYYNSWIISIFYKGIILVLYWLIPFFTWTQIANRLRRVAEHSAVEGKSYDLQTRTTKHGILVRIFLSPKFISYHNEHHIYPGIPCYNLRKAHVFLMKMNLSGTVYTFLTPTMMYIRNVYWINSTKIF